jgi:hypothetical protein
MWETINSSVPSLQAYHVGVEVYGSEYTFQLIYDEPDGTGVVVCKPTQAVGYIFKESIDLGNTSLSQEDVKNVLDSMADKWISKEYHPTRRNCVDFSRALITALRVGQLPSWVSLAADVSKEGGVVGWLAELSWDSIKWYYGI